MYIKDNKITISFRHYLYLLLSFVFVFILDYLVLNRISMVALYSIPLVLSGVYFPKSVAYATGFFAWMLGIFAEIPYMDKNDLVIRYYAIALLFSVILWISFNFSLQTQNLIKNNIKLQNLVLNIIQSLSSAIEAKDVYLKGHSRNVANLAKEIAVHLDLSPLEVNNVYYSALLHDIGKIGIPEAILNKQDRLTEKEFNLIKEHCEVGANIVREIKEFKDFISYIEHHHERWDGHGYPHGLKGEEIPLGARIVAVADAFDAMTSKRPYRKPFSFFQAVEEIKRCSGKQFDKRVVVAFLEYVESLGVKEEGKFYVNAC